MMGSEAVDYEEAFPDIEDDEGENDIVLIEEEYKSMLDEPSELHPEITREDFVFLKLLGSGAHAQVYLAKKRDTEHYYAIKVLDKKQLNKKKQVTGTKIERRILVGIDTFYS